MSPLPLPRPPPPTYSQRYMLTVPYRHPSSHFGFELEPVVCGTRKERSVGAKVFSVDDNALNRKHNVNVGDVLFLIEGKTVKTEYFDTIMSQLQPRSSSITLAFERSTENDVDVKPFRLNNDARIMTLEERADATADAKTVKTPSLRSAKRMERRKLSNDFFEKTTRNDRVDGINHFGNDTNLDKQSPFQHKRTSEPKLARSVHPIFSPCELSREEEVLHSIFSPNVAPVVRGRALAQQQNDKDQRSKFGSKLFESNECSSVQSADDTFDLSNKSVSAKEDSQNLCTSSMASTEDLPAIYEGLEETSSESLQANHCAQADNNRRLFGNEHRLGAYPMIRNGVYHNQLTPLSFSSSTRLKSSISSGDNFSLAGARIAADSDCNSVSLMTSENGSGYTIVTDSVNRTHSLRDYMSPKSDCMSSSLEFKSRSTSRDRINNTTPSFGLPNEDNFQAPINRFSQPPFMDSCTASSVYFSPYSVVNASDSLQANGSKVEQRSFATHGSWKNVPMEMLNIDYVKKCESENQLEVITKVLSEETPSKYPALLRAATNRLQSIRVQHLFPNSSALPKPLSAVEVDTSHQKTNTEDPVFRTFGHSQGLEDSYSPFQRSGERSYEDEESAVGEGDDIENSLSIDRAVHNTLKQDLESALVAHSQLSSELRLVIDERNDIQTQLSAQVDSLTARLYDLEQKALAQSSGYEVRIAVIETAKTSAEAEVRTLKKAVVASSSEARDIMAQLKDRTDEVEHLENRLREEQTAKKSELSAASKTIQQLKNQVANLTKEMLIQDEKAQNIREMVEWELRGELDRFCLEKKVEITDLRNSLSLAQSEVEKLSTKNKRLSRLVNELKKESKIPQKFKDALAEATAAGAAANAMAKALAQSEYELSLVVETNKQSERRIASLRRQKTQAEGENKNLSAKIAYIDEELRSSHVYIDKLYAELKHVESHQIGVERLRAEWKRNEQRYREQISAMKQQIDQAGEMVSVGIYNKAIDAANKVAEELEEKRREVEKLKSRVEEVEVLLSQMRTPSRPKGKFSVCFSSQELSENGVKSLRAQHRKVSTLTDALDVKSPSVVGENIGKASLTTPNSRQKTPAINPGTLKKESRLSAVRAAGGRAGLREKVKKSRATILRSIDRNSISNYETKIIPNGSAEKGLGRSSYEENETKFSNAHALLRGGKENKV